MMNASESHRIFIGIALPEPLKRALGEVQHAFKLRAVKGKWPSPDYFHVTLKYIGTTEIERINEITQVISEAVAKTPPFTLTLGSFASFGFNTTGGHVSLRILYQIIESDAFLNALYANLEAALDSLGIAKETRPYTPHITLGKDVRMPDFAYEQLKLEQQTTVILALNEEVTVAAIQVFKSENVHGSMQYVPIREIKLGGK
ncbi:MAG: RNA 2',3'-cyclic phosphodiesterase [Firmicutes bacterium]|nr:RNA 2',3'-cyclic phosphodiesterase [Bacillota bacterium]